MRVCVGGVYLILVSLLLIGQQPLGHFFRYRPLLPTHKLALTAISKLFALQNQIISAPKNFSNQSHPLVSSSSVNFLSKIFNLSHETAP
jgi:hypothetical protein